MKYLILIICCFGITSNASTNIDFNYLNQGINRGAASSTITRIYSEGVLSEKHNSEFLALKEKYILTKNIIDFQKVKQTIDFLKSRKKQLYNSVYLYKKDKLIKKYGYSNKKASKKVSEEIEEDDSYLFLYDEAIQSLKKLTSNSPINEADRILLYITAAENFQQTHLLSEEVNTLKSLRNFFKKIKLNDPNAIEASNLFKDNKYLSPDEIHELKKNSFDISKINPPNGPLWVNNKIKNYDPYDEKIYEKIKVPKKESEFYYKRMGSGQIKLKAYYLNKKGKKKSVNIKIGREVHAQLYAGQLARILGYSSLPVVYRKNIKLNLGKTSYSEFTIAWDRAHVGGFQASADATARTWFSRSGQYRYDKETHSVTIFEGFVESYPSKGKYYYKGGSFRSARHGLVNRREYRALFIFSSLINLVDNGDKNMRVDAFRNTKEEAWKPIFYFNDLGTSLGNWYSNFNTMAVDEFDEKIAYKKKDGNVHLKYISRHPNEKTYDTATADDFKWLIRRMAKISHKQLIDIGLASGLPSFSADLYAEKIKRRINNLIKVFELNDSKKLKLNTYLDLNKKYPKYISKKGKLKPEADNFDNNTWYNGPSATLIEQIKQGGSNYVHDAISKLVKLEIPFFGEATFYNQIGGALSLSGTRKVEQNNFHGPEQRRLRIHDKWNWSFPFGASTHEIINSPINNSELYLPLSFNMNYEISHIHSAPTLREANLKNYTDVILPWKIDKIKRSLRVGESIRIIQSANFNIGGIKGQISDQFRLQLDALRYLKVKVKEIYIHRYSENELEVVIQKIDQTDWHSGLDIKVLLELAISIGKNTTKTNYSYVRLNLNKSDEKQTQDIYSKLLESRDLGDLNNKTGAHAILSKVEKKEYFGWKFLLWGFNNDSTGIDFNIDAKETRVKKDKKIDHNRYQIFSHSLDKTSNRAISKAWDSGEIDDSDIKQKNILNGLNILLQFFDKQNNQNVTTYIQTDKNVLKIKDMMIFINIGRTDNYIKFANFKKRYIKYFSTILGEKPKDYFDYNFNDEQKYLSPVKALLSFQISLKGIKRLINRVHQMDNLCHGVISCEIGLLNLTNLVKYTNSVLKSKYSLKKRKTILNNNLKRASSFIEHIIGNKAYNLKDLRGIIGNKNIWITTRINGILPSAHPFAVGKNLPLYATEIGEYQGVSPLKKVILKYQFFPKQNFFYDSLLPEVPY